MMNEQPIVEEFSDAYFSLPDIEVREYSGDQFAIADDTMRELGHYVSYPLVKLSTGHHWLRYEYGIPADTIAIPHQEEPATDTPLLAKDSTTKSLLHKGIVEEP